MPSRIFNGLAKFIKNILTIDVRLDALQNDVNELRGDVKRLEQRIDMLYCEFINFIKNSRK